MHSHTETEAKGSSDILDYSEVCRRLSSPLKEFVPAAHAHTLCLWGEERVFDHIELGHGQQVRLKTKGDSVLLGELWKSCDLDDSHVTSVSGLPLPMCDNSNCIVNGGNKNEKEESQVR